MNGKIFLALLLASGLSACSTFKNRPRNKETTAAQAEAKTAPAENKTAEETKPAATETPAQTAQNAEAGMIEDAQIKMIPKSQAEKNEDSATESAQNVPSVAKPESAESTEATASKFQHPVEPKHTHHAGEVSAEKSLGWLKNGNTRYVKNKFRKDGAGAQDRTRNLASQKPHAIVLSCSDSRVPPEVVFDQKLGEIFVVRVAGEALDASTIASIEYAIDHLGSNLLVVMGHESCGAVKATISSLAGADLGSSSLNKLAADIAPRLEQFKNQTPSKGYITEAWANVSGVAHDLIVRSEIVRDAVASGDVKVAQALYHLDSGIVEWK